MDACILAFWVFSFSLSPLVLRQMCIRDSYNTALFRHIISVDAIELSES